MYRMLKETPTVKGKSKWILQICKNKVSMTKVQSIQSFIKNFNKKNPCDYKYMCLCYIKKRNEKKELRLLDP